jgi:hypothetical protein
MRSRSGEFCADELHEAPLSLESHAPAPLAEVPLELTSEPSRETGVTPRATARRDDELGRDEPPRPPPAWPGSSTTEPARESGEPPAIEGADDEHEPHHCIEPAGEPSCEPSRRIEEMEPAFEYPIWSTTEGRGDDVFDG